MSPSAQKPVERGSFHRLVEAIRGEIGSGRLGAGQHLPSVRRLSREHNLACDTVHRAMKALVADGLVAAEPRRGYRVLARGNDPDRGCPVALVLEAPERGGILAEQKLLTVFQNAAGRRGRPVLAIAAGGQPWREVLEQLRVARAWGVILDTCNQEALALVREQGLPAVVVDSWAPEVAVDCVIQDGYRGSALAAAHLVGRGHRRVGWVGPALSACVPLELERFSGAAGALASAGIELTPDLRAGTPAKDYAGYVEGLRRMLSRPDRPTAILAMWQTAAQATAAVPRSSDSRSAATSTSWAGSPSRASTPCTARTSGPGRSRRR
jgi:DNA-binding LacI/PurR family transcriptional regulator